MKNMKNNERGITLVEVIVAALLLVLVLFATLGLYERGVFTWGRGERTADLQDHLRIALNTLGADIREARGLTYLDPTKSVPTLLASQSGPVELCVNTPPSGHGCTSSTNLIALELVPIQSYPLSGGTGNVGAGVKLPKDELVNVCYSWAQTSTGGKPPNHVLRRNAGKIDTENAPCWTWRGSQPIAHHITYLRISSPDPDKPQLVKVELRAEGEYRGRPIEVEVESTFRMRTAP